MLAQFFIRRPVFAWVISIVIMLLGIISINNLPIAQYPDVAPPQVRISATYTGASAETLESSVTQVIEQQLTGLDGLLYFSSSSTASTGQVKITVTFQQGTDPDIAQVQVQNKVQQAESRLPDAVTSQGVTVEKAQSDFLLVMALYDKTNKSTSSDVSDYLVSNMEDVLARVNGVGRVQVFGSEYAMRIWLDPNKLARLLADAFRCGKRAGKPEHPGLIRAVRGTTGQRRAATGCHRAFAFASANAGTVPQYCAENQNRWFRCPLKRCRPG